jgi:hypothetical protein
VAKNSNGVVHRVVLGVLKMVLAKIIVMTTTMMVMMMMMMMVVVMVMMMLQIGQTTLTQAQEICRGRLHESDAVPVLQWGQAMASTTDRQKGDFYILRCATRVSTYTRVRHSFV